MEVTTVSEYEVVKMPERLDTLTSPDVERDMLELLGKGTVKLACDFSETCYVSSAGLRVMLTLFKKLKVVKGSFVLLKLSKDVRDVFSLSGFAQLMDIRDEL